MVTGHTVEYYLARKSLAIAMSQIASEPYIEKLHLEMARRYSELAQAHEYLLESGSGALACETLTKNIVIDDFVTKTSCGDYAYNAVLLEQGRVVDGREYLSDVNVKQPFTTL